MLHITYQLLYNMNKLIVFDTLSIVTWKINSHSETSESNVNDFLQKGTKTLMS